MSIAAIETEYAGHLFRSRLEARWAAFFDLVGWRWTYEPFDGNGYIPDFHIAGDRPLMVEVKPAMTMEELRQHGDRIMAGLRGLWAGDILLLGGTPILSAPTSPWSHRVAAGLHMENTSGAIEPSSDWWSEAGIWTTCTTCRQTAIFHAFGDYSCRPCGHYKGGSSDCLGSVDASVIEGMWGQAHKETRWAPR